MLFIGFEHHAFSGGATQKKFLRQLAEKDGLQVAFRSQEQAYNRQPGNVRPEEFQKFDVLVYLNPPWVNPEKRKLSETFSKQWAAALNFVKKGGGLLFCPYVGEGYLLAVRKCFAELGLIPLRAIPAAREFVPATVMHIPWVFTDRLEGGHPILKGIRGLWVPAYPGRKAEVWNANSVAFRADDNWQVLARFPSSVEVAPYPWQGPGRELPQPTAADQRAAPILAVRQLGQGRIAFLGIDAAYHIVGGLAPGYEGIFLEQGLKGQPSGGRTLIVNLLKWLGKGARKNPELGGASTDPASIAGIEFKPLPPLEKPQSFAGQRKGYRGVIGAFSPRSGGENSVAEFAVRARELGFDFLVVLDDIQKVNAQQFEQLNREAAAATSKDFACIPGLRFRDEVGNRYVAFRRGLTFPTKVMLRQNKRFYTVIRKDERSSGTGGLGLARWVQANGHHMAIVHYRDRHDLESKDPYEYGVPPWDIRPYRQFHSVFTYDAEGKRIDDMVEEHKTVVDDGQHPHPVAITFLKRAADLEKVASGALPYTVRWTNNFAEFPQDTGEEPAYLPTTFATEGPVITRWQWDSRDLVNNGKYWDWTYYYQRWAVGVHSAAGLGKVEIWDGKDLLFRWQPGGAKQFEKVVLVNKHQLTMPLVIATDVNGKRVVTDGFQWRSHNFYVSWCSDRVNTLSYSALPSPESPWGSSAGNWAIATQPKGPMWDNLRLDVNLDALRFPGFDGQASGGALISPNFYLHAAPGQPRDGRLYRHITWPMASQEAVIQEFIFRHQLLPEQAGPHAWSTLGPIKPTEVFDARLRYTTFVHYGHRPAPVLVQGEVTFKQDVKCQTTRAPFTIAQVSAHRAEAAYRAVSVLRTGSQDHVFPIFYNHRDHQSARGDFPAGAYVWYFPSTFGPMGIISFSNDLHYRLNNGDRNRACVISLGQPGQQFRKGDVVRWKYLAVTSGFNDFSGTDTPEHIIDFMGIDGSPGYEIEPISGKVLGTSYLLRLEPGEGGAGFLGAIRPGPEIARRGLPAALPLVAEGLHDHWTAVLYDETLRAMRPLPVAEGRAYAHYKDLRKPHTIFMGHPFICDDPEIVLTVVQTGPRSLHLHVHNPSDRQKAVTVRKAGQFRAFPKLFQKKSSWSWTLPPGSDKSLSLGPPTRWTMK